MAPTEGGSVNVSSETAKTKRVFPHSASVGDITLDDEMGGEYGDLQGADEVAVLGYEVISTTGDFYIERDTLLTVMDEVGLPEWMAPSETAPHRAFGRARDELLEDGYDVNTEYDERARITFRLESAEGASRVYNLLANFHVPEEYVDIDGGLNNQYELGVIMYDSESQTAKFRDKIDASDGDVAEGFASFWEEYQLRFARLFDKHLNGHVGKDINTMFNQYFINQWTDSVQLRPAVYFVPATQQLPQTWSDTGDVKTMRDLIGYDEGSDGDRQGFAGLYAYINDVKEQSAKTEDTEIIRLPVYDNADQREMVQKKVRQELEDAVSGAYSSILTKMKDDDSVAEDVAEAVADRFDNMDTTASNYKSIIQTEMAVEEVMADVLDDMDDSESQVIRDVVNELDVMDSDD